MDMGTMMACILAVLFAVMLVLVLSIIFHRRPAEAAAEEPQQPQENVPAREEFDLPEDILAMLENENVSEPEEDIDIAFPDDPFDDMDLTETLSTEAEDETEAAGPVSAEISEPEPVIPEITEADLNEEAEEKPAQIHEEDYASLLVDPDDGAFDQELIDRLFADEDPEFAPPEEEVKPAEEKKVSPPAEPVRPYAISNADIIRQGVSAAWAESEVIMSANVFGDALLYEWEGLVKDEKVILFDLDEHQLGYPFLETARSISAANKKPSCRFACLIHTSNSNRTADLEKAAAHLREKGRTPAYMISDSASVHFEDANLSAYGCITAGSRPSITLTCEADPTTAEAFAKEAAGSYKPDHINETALEAFSVMKKNLPVSLRSGLSGGFGAEKAVRRLAQVIPETAGWVFPEADVTASGTGSLIRLKAPDADVLEDALALIREAARRKGYALRAVEKQDGGAPVSMHDDAFKEAAAALRECAQMEAVIPVLADKDYTAKGIRSIGLPVEGLTRRQLYAVLRQMIDH